MNEALKKHFRPEFLNRIDEIIIFDTLTRENLLDIVEKVIKKFEDVDESIPHKEVKKKIIIEMIFCKIILFWRV